jgi:hypothetical protein
MYDRIEAELKEVQQALYSSRVVSTVPLSSEGTELGDEPSQPCRIEDENESLFSHVHEGKKQAIEALKQAQEEAIEKHWVVQQEKDDLQEKFTKARSRIYKEKE